MASGNQNLTTYLAKGLAHRILNQTSLDGLSGTHAFSGSGEPWAGSDWVGLQIGDSVDKFQVAAKGNTLLFRQNDSGGTNTSWQSWVTMLTSSNYTDYTVTKTGGGASGTWGISITGKAGSVDWANTGHPSTFPPSSHTHYELATIGDKRNENTTPDTYVNRLIFQGLKTNTKINSPYTDSYSYLVGLRGWADSSGGNSHELAFNGNGIYRRQGATTTWGNWFHILDSNNYTSYTVTKTGSGASGTWSISITGNAATATALTSNAGNSNTPVYFSGGKPVTTNNKLGAISDGSYWGMRGADNGDGWIRTTSSGIIPVQSGGAGSGHSGLGTSSWYFSYLYVDNSYAVHQRSSGRAYMGEWIEFSCAAGGGGLYCPNGNGAHWYPNNASTYGTWAMQGSRGGYNGIHFGNNTNYMTVMDQGTYKGLFQEGKEWILCYRKDTAHVGIGNNDPGYKLDVSGDIRARNAWLRTTGATGWYNDTYGGGWYMQDSTYIRNYGSKHLYITGRLGVDCELRLWGNTRQITRASRSVGWINGRDSALIREDNADGYHGVVMTKTVNGAWTIGNYNYSGWYNYLLFSYTSDSNYNAGTNTATTIRMRDSGVVESAMWNDYAEYRKANTIEPGRVVIETGNDDLQLCNQRLVAGGRVISDTYGFAIGQTKDCQTPIAVSGRVLVYPYRNRNKFKPGDAVCTAPNGTVDVMTRREIVLYPERIIGTVSAVPTYETWYGGGNYDEDGDLIPIPVNGRIWIYVR